MGKQGNFQSNASGFHGNEETTISRLHTSIEKCENKIFSAFKRGKSIVFSWSIYMSLLITTFSNFLQFVHFSGSLAPVIKNVFPKESTDGLGECCRWEVLLFFLQVEVYVHIRITIFHEHCPITMKTSDNLASRILTDLFSAIPVVADWIDICRHVENLRAAYCVWQIGVLDWVFQSSKSAR